jgi:hypothetical protein
MRRPRRYWNDMLIISKAWESQVVQMSGSLFSVMLVALAGERMTRPRIYP